MPLKKTPDGLGGVVGGARVVGTRSAALAARPRMAYAGDQHTLHIAPFGAAVLPVHMGGDELFVRPDLAAIGLRPEATLTRHRQQRLTAP